jgi:hypothetical protein
VTSLGLFASVPDPHPDLDPLCFGHPGSASGSVSQRYGSEYPHPDLYQNVTDPQRWFGGELETSMCFLLISNKFCELSLRTGYLLFRIV